MKYKNKTENLDIQEIVNSSFINWEFFKNKKVLITNATGLVSSQIIKALILANSKFETNIEVIAIAQDKKAVHEIYSKKKEKNLKFIYQDIRKKIRYKGQIDYIIYTENNLYPQENIIEYSLKSNAKSIVYLSSIDEYEKAPVNYTQFNIPVKIARLGQIISASIDLNDDNTIAQFARNIVQKEDIVLTTKDETVRYYCYSTDVAVAILSMLEKGVNGESYNIINSEAICTIKDMAKMLCNKYTGSNLVISENNSESKPTSDLKILNTENYQNKSDWQPTVSLEEGYNRVINSFVRQKTSKSNKSEYTFLEKVFSMKNINQYKVIKILGATIKINRKKFLKKYYKLPIKQNKIVFSNYMGKGFGCNPKYIAEEILNRGLNYDLVWLAKKDSDMTDTPNKIRIVDYSSKQALKELITAKVWVDNYHKISMIKKGLRKRDNQTYIQTWHGSLGIKKIEKTVDCLTENKDWEQNAIINSQMTDYWISNSKFETDVYRTSFWDVKDIKELGHPRNDVFFRNSEEAVNKVKAYCSIPQDTNILLYAPSFREDEGIGYYQLTYQKVLDALETKTGKKWVALSRLHPRVAKFSKILLENEPNVVDVSDYPDIQELLISADIMITDYSSCIFDFMLAGKPAFIYATDIEQYNTERGFYYPLETTPFPIAQNNDELIENIHNFKIEEYKNKLELFLKDKGCIEDGNAAKRVVDLIERIVNNA